MMPSKNFYRLLIQFEGLKLKAYLDSANIPTIGIGTILYPDGRKVSIHDTCTEAQAMEWAEHDAENMALKLSVITPPDLHPHQFDALLLLMYNIGVGALSRSTVLKRIKAGASEDLVRAAWLMWNKAGGKIIPGLINRRNKELDLYFS